MNPRSIPASIPTVAATTPTNMVLGVPTIQSASISRPLFSVPSGCSGTPSWSRQLVKPSGGKFSGARADSARFVSQN